MPPLSPGLARFGRYQVGSLLATGTDWLVMIGLVELLRVDPVTATALGATLGGVVGFTLGRKWVFRVSGSVPHQALRYVGVWAVGTALNAGGEHVLLALLGNYLVARFIVATVVGIGWNYEMGRRFVFRRAAP